MSAKPDIEKAIKIARSRKGIRNTARKPKPMLDRRLGVAHLTGQ
jgi:hypothetical protein